MDFKKIFKKENIMPVAVLCGICLVVAVLMGTINLVTEPIIKKAEEQKVYDSLRVVLDGEFEEVALPEGAPATANGLYRVTEDGELKGHVVTVVTKGYAGEIAITVGVDADGKITKAVITKQSETHGKSGMSAYPDNFAGKGADDIGQVETFTGATISSTAIKKAITDALNTALGNAGAEPEPEPEQLPRPETEIQSLAATLVGAGADLENVTPEGVKFDYVKRIYKDKGGKGYVAYVAVISANYGTVETETLVHISAGGKIVGVDKLVWKTSDAIYGYVPPEESAVDAFYATFAGKTLAQFKDAYVKTSDTDEVEHITNATNTTGNLVASLLEAFEQIDGMIKRDMPRAEADVEAAAGALLGDGVTVENVTPTDVDYDYVRRVYSDGNGGYVIYLVAISPDYGTPETETLIHLNNKGEIAEVEKLLWKTSDALWGYVPPTAEEVDAFYATFAGKNLDEFKVAYVKESDTDEVEHVTNATNTTDRLIDSMVEAFEAAEALGYENKDFAARIVGIVALALAIAAPVAIIGYNFNKRRKR